MKLLLCYSPERPTTFEDLSGLVDRISHSFAATYFGGDRLGFHMGNAISLLERVCGDQSCGQVSIHPTYINALSHRTVRVTLGYHKGYLSGEVTLTFRILGFTMVEVAREWDMVRDVVRVRSGNEEIMAVR